MQSRTPLQCALKDNPSEAVKTYLGSLYGAQLEKDFLEAAQTGDVATVQKCLVMGVNPNVRNNKIARYTALHLAVEANQSEVLMPLIMGGVSYKLKDGNGLSARDLAECRDIDAPLQEAIGAFKRAKFQSKVESHPLVRLLQGKVQQLEEEMSLIPAGFRKPRLKGAPLVAAEAERSRQSRLYDEFMHTIIYNCKDSYKFPPHLQGKPEELIQGVLTRGFDLNCVAPHLMKLILKDLDLNMLHRLDSVLEDNGYGHLWTEIDLDELKARLELLFAYPLEPTGKGYRDEPYVSYRDLDNWYRKNEKSRSLQQWWKRVTYPYDSFKEDCRPSQDWGKKPDEECGKAGKISEMMSKLRKDVDSIYEFVQQKVAQHTQEASPTATAVLGK